jgi:hypothetical protein
MDEFVAWLRSQLDEDEQIARATHPAFLAWDYDDCVMQVRDLGNGNELANVLPRHEYGVHIAEWDPARVLREIEAKRGLLKRHRFYVPEPDQACLGCAAGVMWRSCPVVRLLIAPYSHRPGYAEALAALG